MTSTVVVCARSCFSLDSILGLVVRPAINRYFTPSGEVWRFGDIWTCSSMTTPRCICCRSQRRWRFRNRYLRSFAPRYPTDCRQPPRSKCSRCRPLAEWSSKMSAMVRNLRLGIPGRENFQTEARAVALTLLMSNALVLSAYSASKEGYCRRSRGATSGVPPLSESSGRP